MVHILVVDDEPEIRALMGRGLRQAGFEVSEATDGDDALKQLDRLRIDVMILDLLMPGKEGLETLIALRQRKHAIKIIAVSGGSKSVSTDFLQAALKLGADRALKKPFRNEELLTIIRELL